MGEWDHDVTMLHSGRLPLLFIAMLQGIGGFVVWNFVSVDLPGSYAASQDTSRWRDNEHEETDEDSPILDEDCNAADKDISNIDGPSAGFDLNAVLGKREVLAA